MNRIFSDKVKRFASMRFVLPLVLVFILLAQSVVFLYFGEKKEGFHIDSIWAFGCANNYDFAILHEQPDFANRWREREENYYHDYVTVQQGEQFSYSSVYRNMTQDNHPPLYFFILHTICSFFPDQISKWMAIMPNLLFTLLTVWVLYKVGVLLLKSPWLALLPAAFWGFSAAAIGMLLFVRMYALMTLFSTLLIYLHLVFLFQDQTPQPRWLFPAMLATTFLGIMTQYYFLVFCFFLCGLTFLWLLLTHQYKRLLCYSATEAGGLLASIAFFPHMIFRLFFVDRGVQAVSNLKDFSNFKENMIQYLTQIGRHLFDGFFLELAIVFGLLLLVVLVRTFFVKISIAQTQGKAIRLDFELFPRRSASLNVTREDGVLLGLLCIIVGYVMAMAKIAPYQILRYFSCLTPIMMLCFFMVALWIFKFYRHKKICLVILCFLMMMITISSYDNRIQNLFIGEAKRSEIAKSHRDYPAIAIYKGQWASPQDVLNFIEYASVLNLRSTDLEMLDDPTTKEKVKDGMMLYLGKNIDSDEFRAQISKKFQLYSVEKLYSYWHSTVYFLSPGEQAVTAEGAQSNE